MNLFHSSDSPFVILWYFYLIFLGTVLGANIVFKIISLMIARRSKKLLARRLVRDTGLKR